MEDKDIIEEFRLRFKVVDAKETLKESIFDAIRVFYEKTGLNVKSIEISPTNYSGIIINIQAE